MDAPARASRRRRRQVSRARSDPRPAADERAGAPPRLGGLPRCLLRRRLLLRRFPCGRLLRRFPCGRLLRRFLRSRLLRRFPCGRLLRRFLRSRLLRRLLRSGLRRPVRIRRHLRAGTPRFGETDRDRLLAALHLLVRAAALELALLALVHHLPDLRLRLLPVLRHVVPPLRQGRCFAMSRPPCSHVRGQSGGPMTAKPMLPGDRRRAYRRSGRILVGTALLRSLPRARSTLRRWK